MTPRERFVFFAAVCVACFSVSVAVGSFCRTLVDDFRDLRAHARKPKEVVVVKYIDRPARASEMRTVAQ